MASLVNRSGNYSAQFYDSTRTPKRKRLSLNTSRKSEARKRLTQLERDWENGTFDPWYDDPRTYKQPERKTSKPLTLSEALEAFLTEKEETGRSADTIRNYRSFCGILVREAGEHRPVRRLKAEDVEAYVRDDSIAAASRRSRFRHVRAWLRWCERQGYVKQAVTDGMTAPPKGEKMPKAVRMEDLREIEATIRADYAKKRECGQAQKGEIIWMIPLLWFGLYSGIRSSELARLRWKHIDFKRGLIRILRQKNGKQQTVPITAPARRILEDLPIGEPEAFVFAAPGTDRYERDVDCFKNNLGRKFRRYRKAAGIERRLTPHGLRHGFCTILAEAGKAAPIIKEAARHADVSTSMKYVHIANEKLKRELDDVFS